jgi:hypothetical protein
VGVPTVAFEQRHRPSDITCHGDREPDVGDDRAVVLMQGRWHRKLRHPSVLGGDPRQDQGVETFREDDLPDLCEFVPAKEGLSAS